jgi:hypothetical protein
MRTTIEGFADGCGWQTFSVVADACIPEIAGMDDP